MKMKYLLSLALVTLPIMAQATEGRDPFSPYSVDPKAAAKAKQANQGDVTITPLTEQPLSEYRLIGVIVSPSDAVGLIKSRNRQEFFVTVGEELGSEGGRIDTISGEGIVVDINGKLTDLTVSNRFGLENETPTE